jgi:hypothetical protein
VGKQRSFSVSERGAETDDEAGATPASDTARQAGHATEVWVDRDGDHALVNTVQGHRKVPNARRDLRVA